jgi:cellulose synthase/poly-beta-1,6-N-acetylglucosamine synthase-like glycosyltransferase
VKLIQSWRQRTRWAQGGIQVTFRYTKDYSRGLKRGGWVGWSTFEAITLSLWGLGFGFLSGVMGLVTGILSVGVVGGVVGTLVGIGGTFLSMMAMAAWTMFTEHKRIYATTWQRIKGLFSFPLYVLTWLPISVLAVFRKFEWVPIEHTEAISVDALENK